MTFEFFMKKVMGVSGSGSKVLDDSGKAQLDSAASSRSASGGQSHARSAPAVAKAAEGEALVKFEDEEAVRQGVRNVRSDNSPEDW